MAVRTRAAARNGRAAALVHINNNNNVYIGGMSTNNDISISSNVMISNNISVGGLNINNVNGVFNYGVD